VGTRREDNQCFRTKTLPRRLSSRERTFYGHCDLSDLEAAMEEFARRGKDPN
jgi:hypothetical protein